MIDHNIFIHILYIYMLKGYKFDYCFSVYRMCVAFWYVSYDIAEPYAVQYVHTQYSIQHTT